MVLLLVAFAHVFIPLFSSHNDDFPLYRARKKRQIKRIVFIKPLCVCEYKFSGLIVSSYLFILIIRILFYSISFFFATYTNNIFVNFWGICLRLHFLKNSVHANKESSCVQKCAHFLVTRKHFNSICAILHIFACTLVHCIQINV